MTFFPARCRYVVNKTFSFAWILPNQILLLSPFVLWILLFSNFFLFLYFIYKTYVCLLLFTIILKITIDSYKNVQIKFLFNNNTTKVCYITSWWFIRCDCELLLFFFVTIKIWHTYNNGYNKKVIIWCWLTIYLDVVLIKIRKNNNNNKRWILLVVKYEEILFLFLLLF